MQANEGLITQLQARVRGAKVRRPYKERLQFLSTRQEETVKLQAAWKGFKQRKAYKERLDYLSQQAAVAVKVRLIMYTLREMVIFFWFFKIINYHCMYVMLTNIYCFMWYVDPVNCKDVEGKGNLQGQN